MNICIVYRDLFSKGGVPLETRSFILGLCLEYSVTILVKNGQYAENEIIEESERIRVIKYSNILELVFLLVKTLGDRRFDIVIGVGFFMLDVFVTSLCTKFSGNKFLLWPIGQLSEESIKGKIFNKYPDVRSLENSKEMLISKIIYYVLGRLAKYYKNLYVKTIGALTIRCSSLIGVFSEYESDQVRLIYPWNNSNTVIMRWGIDVVKMPMSDMDFYSEYFKGVRKFNFIYWGRMDWNFKGIDRILNSVVKAKELMCEKDCLDLPFRILLCGPDYNNGISLINKFILEKQLSDDVFLITNQDYTPGSSDPLFYADASILLSRWDGFPRTIRESILMGLPVLVSEETHFSGFVKKNGNGWVMDKDASIAELAQVFLTMSSIQELDKRRKASSGLSEKISWRNVSNNAIKQIKNFVL